MNTITENRFATILNKIINYSNLYQSSKHLTYHFIETLLGQMIAIADENFLYILEFIDTKNLENDIETLLKRLNAQLIYGQNAVLKQLENELNIYFSGQLIIFETPISLLGSSFQKTVWENLKTIPIGETRSYKDLAKNLGSVYKARAVGNANGKNPVCILVPCHRVINSDGSLGGYSSGVERKQFLLDLEMRAIKQ